jgi:membrane protein implicated in regulation of membrane protease activity
VIAEPEILGLNLSEFFVILGLCLLVLEIVTSTFLLLGFAIGAFITAALIFMVQPNLHFILISFGITSLASCYFLRRLFARRGDAHVNENDINRY